VPTMQRVVLILHTMVLTRANIHPSDISDLFGTPHPKIQAD